MEHVKLYVLTITCETICSDNGTNFVGAQKELNLNSKDVARELSSVNCQWNFNLPGTSHFGGVYERKIGSIQRVLEKSILLAGQMGLSKDEFHTLLYEVSSIVNQTSLSEVCTQHPDDPCPLTPKMLLTVKSSDSNHDLRIFFEKDLLKYG